MAHGRSAYSHGCRCEACTAAQRDYMREYLRARRGPRHTRDCPGCGVTFSPSGRRLWCSDRCKDRIQGREYRRRVGQLRKAGAARRRAELAALRAAAGTASVWVWCQGDCAECGEFFTRHGEPSPYCSKACSTKEARRRRRALMRGAKVSQTSRFAIHERDGWACHICGDLVNRDAIVPELDAPTLDHVVALAAGGSHTEANLRTAHFYCNSVKRDLSLSAVA